MMGHMLYSPPAMNECFMKALATTGWKESRVTYWVTEDEKLNPPDAHQKSRRAKGRHYRGWIHTDHEL